MDMLRRSVKAQFREANRQNAQYTAVIGENELEAEEVTLKNMATGDEKSLPFSDIKQFLLKKIE
jgi:histidyl-tRNA synthetase